MAFERQPALEMAFVGGEIDAGDADLLKSELLCPVLDLFDGREGHHYDQQYTVHRTSAAECTVTADLPIFSPEQVRERDRVAIETHGIPGYTLMTRAGRAALNVLRARWPGARRPLVLCGAGNNAGDGYVLARLAADIGLEPTVVPVFDPERLRGDAARAWQDYRPVVDRGRGHLASQWSDALLGQSDVVVDALFGTGLAREVTDHPAQIVGRVNASGLPVLALDVPSGLSAATGEALGVAVAADATITFVGRKIGFYVGSGQDFVGTVYFDDLGIDQLAGIARQGVATLLDPAALGALLPRRRRTSHKASHGHVLIVGGAEGMSGAARLAGEAALYAGAGLVSVATSPAHAAWLNVGRPELMCRGVRSAQDLAPLLERADVVVAGPGLGTDSSAQQLLEAVLARALPRVLDADALNLLANGALPISALGAKSGAPARTVITPHPGEAARLLGTSTGEVQADRLTASARLVAATGAVCVLKGAGSVVGTVDRLPAICDRGNPGMAAAGMGDVLSGVIGALLAQLGDPAAAAGTGALVHAMAGDAAAARLGIERGLMASDLFDDIRRLVNPVGDRG
jgi:hydroxyethylthiazole kinase-like uncharacterized protein yjeF